jgi:hypothetical protein
MVQWIARLLRRKPMELECVNTLGQDGLEVRVCRLPLPCGHDGHVVEIISHSEDFDHWTRIGVLSGADVHTLASLLTDVARYLDREETQRFARVLEDD